MATQQSEKLREATTKWLRPSVLNVAVALHVPNAFRAQHGADERALQYKLRRFFTRLDRKVLKAACRHGKRKIPRFVVLENSKSVGWHVHALLSSKTSKFSAERLCTIIKLMWLDEFGNQACKGFERRLAWAQKARTRYARYMTKSLYGTNASAVFDEMNSVSG